MRWAILGYEGRTYLDAVLPFGRDRPEGEGRNRDRPEGEGRNNENPPLLPIILFCIRVDGLTVLLIGKLGVLTKFQTPVESHSNPFKQKEKSGDSVGS